jgi:GNAT superfamily N-acetyltransferase
MIEFVTGGPDLEAVLPIVNAAYAAGEDGMWKPGADRINLEQLRAVAEKGELAVARRDGAVVGCIRTRPGYFGLLSVDPSVQGAGAGRELVAFAEERSRAAGATTMHLQLLVPRAGEHPFKVRLHDWYSRLGYEVVTRVPCEVSLPDSVPYLAIPCDLVDYEKSL